MRNPCILGNVVVNLWMFWSIWNFVERNYIPRFLTISNWTSGSRTLEALCCPCGSLSFSEDRFSLCRKKSHFCFLMTRGMPEAWDILKPRHSCIAASYHGTSRCNIVRNSKNVLDGICHRYAEIRKDNRRLTLCTFEIYNFVMCFFFVCFVASWLRTPPVCDCPGPTTLPAGYGRAVSAT